MKNKVVPELIIDKEDNSEDTEMIVSLEVQNSREETFPSLTDELISYLIECDDVIEAFEG